MSGLIEGKKNGNNEVIIIDYQLGNLFSVKHACIHVGLEPIITSDKDIIKNAKALILPGVGAFGTAMYNLEKFDLISPILDHVHSGKQLLGVCLGMQLLFTESEEFGGHKGLNLIEGTINKFPNIYKDMKMKVPNISWNSIYSGDQKKWDLSPLSDIAQQEFMYFVHSFYAKPANKDDILTLTNYGGIEYCSSVLKSNIFATQFHPEKSGQEGIKIYKNFKKLNYDNR